MKQKQYLISIITINFNQSGVTNQLLKSLKKISWPNYEIIVIDNGSENEDYKNIDTSDPHVKLICKYKNLGFAGGNNVGLKAAKGDFLLLLNNDTEVAPDFIEPMVELFEKHTQAGAVSPKIKFFDQPELIQYAGYGRLNPFTLRLKGIGFKKYDDGSFDKVAQTNYAHGCAMMIPRHVLETVGKMTEDYFLYYEEHDWSAAISRKGFQIWYQPNSLVLHKESVSVKKGSVLKTYFINRNRILFMKRNLSFTQKLFSSLYLFLVSIPYNILKYALKKEFNHLKAYRDSIIWNINHKTKEKWNF